MDPKASIIPFLAFFTVFVMIDELLVRNIALISDAQISFAPGLTALTGETGAGKTALLSALKLLMGERADSSCVREGEAGALVQGRLYRSDADIEGFVVERRLSADGRSRVKIDGSLASVSELASQVRPLVDICGQHEHQHLLDTAYHLTMVDTWSRDTIAPAHAAYIAAFREHKRQLREYEELERAARTQGSRLEEARFCVERIEEVDPKPDELEELEEILPRAEHAEALATSANDAQEYLSGEGGALDTLNSAIAELSRMGSVDAALAGFADELSGAAITMEDAAAELRRYRDSVDFDPADLASKHERLGALNALKRQFGPSMDDVFERYRQSSELLSLVNDSDARLARAKRLVDDSERVLQDAAKKLARRRAAAGPRFCREVGKQLARLEMGSAELVWQVRDLDRKAWTESGSCSYELLYRSGAGLTLRAVSFRESCLPAALFLERPMASRQWSLMKSMLAWAEQPLVPLRLFFPILPARIRLLWLRIPHRLPLRHRGITWSRRIAAQRFPLPRSRRLLGMAASRKLRVCFREIPSKCQSIMLELF